MTKHPKYEQTTEEESEKVLGFVNATENDIFYDLGCGDATTCIVASKIFKLKNVIGVEADTDNYLNAAKKIQKNNLIKRIGLWHEFVENVDFSDATIVYYTIKPNKLHLEHLKKMIKTNCRLITPRLPLPTIKPTNFIKINNEMFFVTIGSLQDKVASDPDEWARSFLGMKFNSIKELYIHFYHDELWLRDLFNQIY